MLPKTKNPLPNFFMLVSFFMWKDCPSPGTSEFDPTLVVVCWYIFSGPPCICVLLNEHSWYVLYMYDTGEPYYNKPFVDQGIYCSKTLEYKEEAELVKYSFISKTFVRWNNCSCPFATYICTMYMHGPTTNGHSMKQFLWTYIHGICMFQITSYPKYVHLKEQIHIYTTFLSAFHDLNWSNTHLVVQRESVKTKWENEKFLFQLHALNWKRYNPKFYQRKWHKYWYLLMMNNLLNNWWHTQLRLLAFYLSVPWIIVEKVQILSASF